MPRCFRYSPSGSMGRRNFPCSTVNAHTENSMGARFDSSTSASSIVTESLPPERATATRSPSRIILKRVTASPTLRSNVFSRSKELLYEGLLNGRRENLLVKRDTRSRGLERHIEHFHDGRHRPEAFGYF